LGGLTLPVRRPPDHFKMNKTVLLVLMTFAISITPSVSDAAQLHRQYQEDGREGIHPFTWIGAWYAGLFLLLWFLWKKQ
jgi:hypothetical protein